MKETWICMAKSIIEPYWPFKNPKGSRSGRGLSTKPAATNAKLLGAARANLIRSRTAAIEKLKMTIDQKITGRNKLNGTG